MGKRTMLNYCSDNFRKTIPMLPCTSLQFVHYKKAVCLGAEKCWNSTWHIQSWFPTEERASFFCSFCFVLFCSYIVESTHGVVSPVDLVFRGAPFSICLNKMPFSNSNLGSGYTCKMFDCSLVSGSWDFPKRTRFIHYKLSGKFSRK